MTKPELGTKRRCNSCATKFFDLNKEPIVCPKCAAVFAPTQSDPMRSGRLPERRPWSAQKTPMPAMPTDLSGDDDLSNADEEEITSTTDAEEVGEEEVLMDDQDGGVDPAEVLGTDIEKDDT